jgi:aminodeoxyfutalosine deaminase
MMARMSSSPVTLKARYIFPIDAPPIAGGTVTVCDDQIVGFGDSPANATVRDLGNTALLPALVNAHTHLELSGVEHPLGSPGVGMADWIGEVLRFRQSHLYDPVKAVEYGIEQSVQSGTGLIADITRADWPVDFFEPDLLAPVGFMELIGWRSDQVEAIVDQARDYIDRLSNNPKLFSVGLSPHAPHTVCRELLQHIVEESARKQFPLAIHLAESAEELRLLKNHDGPLRALMDRTGRYDPSEIFVGPSPLDYLNLLAEADRTLIVHGNYLDSEEIDFLANRNERMAVVFCPRCHERFGHRRYPLAELLKVGVTVALGTDSRATTPDLSVWNEARTVWHAFPEIGPATILRLATAGGASALGLSEQFGSIAVGKKARFFTVRLPDREADPYELLFGSR